MDRRSCPFEGYPDKIASFQKRSTSERALTLLGSRKFKGQKEICNQFGHVTWEHGAGIQNRSEPLPPEARTHALGPSWPVRI